MYKFSLYEDAKDLKIKLKTCTFFGESCWTKSANICKGDIIPILMKDENSVRYLRSMKWGTNLFGNDTKNIKQLQNQARDDKLLSRNNKNNPWVELVTNGQRCVIVAKGFYINNYTEIYNAKYKTKQTDRQTYFVTPYIASEGQFFYIAALYRVQQLWQTKKYGVISITKSTKDNELKKYSNRMPYLLRPRDIDDWLNAKVSIQSMFSLKYRIKYNEFRKIGLWLDDDLIKDENKILRSRREWEFEKNAKITGMEEDDFPWDKIEQEALRQNEAKKYGFYFKPKDNWDELRQKKMNSDDNNNGTEYNLDDDGELKQEEYKETDNNVRKRQRKKNTNAENLEPVTKKQKINQKEKRNIARISNRSQT